MRGRGAARGAARGGARRTTRRRTTRRRRRRRVRRRRRRRILLVGGAVLLGVGAYGAVKMSKQDADRVEKHTGTSVEELTEEELVQAMKDLGIESIELTDEDKAALAAEGGAEGGQAGSSYVDDLERLAALRDQGAISEEEYEEKKKQLLGL